MTHSVAAICALSLVLSACATPEQQAAERVLLAECEAGNIEVCQQLAAEGAARDERASTWAGVGALALVTAGVILGAVALDNGNHYYYRYKGHRKHYGGKRHHYRSHKRW